MNRINTYKDRFYESLHVVEDLGYLYATDKSLRKNRFLIVKCVNCNHIFKTTANNISKLSKNNCIQKHSSRQKKDDEWNRIRQIHRKIIQRCYNKNDKNYFRYGALGIDCHDGWKNSLELFYNWSILNGYKNNLTIDRIDNNRGYYPENCRWSTLKEQARNKKNTLSISEVKRIKVMLKEGYINRVIAQTIGITKSKVDDISSGKTWKD